MPTITRPPTTQPSRFDALKEIFGKDQKVQRALVDDMKRQGGVSDEMVDALVSTMAGNSRLQPGDDMMPGELAMLRQFIDAATSMGVMDGNADAARAKVESYESEPQFTEGSVAHNDGSPDFAFEQTRLGTIRVEGTAWGNIPIPPNVRMRPVPSTLTFEIDDKTFYVEPRRGESAASIADRLCTKLQSAGYDVSVSEAGGGHFVKVDGKTPPPPLDIRVESGAGINLSVDDNVIHFSTPAGGAGPVTLGGSLKVSIGDKSVEIRTLPLEDPGEALLQLVEQLEAATGFDIIVDRKDLDDAVRADLTVVRPGETQRFPAGAYNDIRGTLSPDRRAAEPFGGTWLVLDEPVMVGDQRVDEIKVDVRHKNVVGDQAHLNGRFDVKTFGDRTYVELTGISDLGRGEPIFDGFRFAQADTGYELPMLRFRGRMMAVDDRVAEHDFLNGLVGKIWVGAHVENGDDLDGINPFGGFTGMAELRAATPADQAEVKATRGGLEVEGRKLIHVGRDSEGTLAADAPQHDFYVDPGTNKLYQWTAGGLFRPMGRVRAVAQIGTATPPNRPDVTVFPGTAADGDQTYVANENQIEIRGDSPTHIVPHRLRINLDDHELTFSLGGNQTPAEAARSIVDQFGELPADIRDKYEVTFMPLRVGSEGFGVIFSAAN